MLLLLQELVTLGPLAEGRADPSNSGIHLTPAEFHDMLLRAAGEARLSSASSSSVDTRHAQSAPPEVPASSSESTQLGSRESGTVIVDCRNLYETSIGHFEVEGVPLLDPKTRCFGDLPAWFDRVAHSLKGKRVLM